jgi:protein phosphatase
MLIAAVLLVLVVLAGLAIGREIVRNNYYVAEHDGTVSIMRGVQGSFLGLALQEPYRLGCLNARNELSLIGADENADNLDCRLMAVGDMRPSERAQVTAGLPGATLDEAFGQIGDLARSSVLPVCATPDPTTTAPPPPPTSQAPREPSVRGPGGAAAAPEIPTIVAPATPSPAASPPPTVTALPPPPPKPGTNCRAVS